MAEPEHGSSPLAEALARIGDRWTPLVVEALLPGPLRFNDLLSQIPGIAANILSDRLKRLERDGLLPKLLPRSLALRILMTGATVTSAEAHAAASQS